MGTGMRWFIGDMLAGKVISFSKDGGVYKISILVSPDYIINYSFDAEQIYATDPPNRLTWI